MIAHLLQRFSAVVVFVAVASAAAKELQQGEVSALSFRDVDGNTLSTTDGHVMIVTVVTRANEDNAQAVADHVPDRCVGDPKYRYVTLVNFEGKIMGPLRGLTRTIIRQRLDAEGRKLKPEYDAKRITRDPRKDIFVVADFDGSAVKQLGLTPENAALEVFVFDPRGKLIERWNAVPPEDSLAKAIAAAER
jgi:hypothetical protein